jgi:peptidoglycan/xylan/chitin deacetylase (PgdA/CDA1 family)
MKGWASRYRALIIGASLLGALLVPAPAHATSPPRAWLGAVDGGVFTMGSAPFRGSKGGTSLPSPVIAIAARPSGNGYWLASLAGDVYPFGDATSHGSEHGIHLNQPMVDIVSSPSGNGYWMVAADGGVFSYGDAHYHGGLGGVHINKPITGMVPTSTGKGYLLVASDGGVFTFGDAHFRGSLGGTSISSPVSAMAVRPTADGYWLLRRDGHVTNFAHAPGLGDATGHNATAIGIVASTTGNGYWVAFADGYVRGFGDAAHLAGPAGPLNAPVVGLATPTGSSSGFALALIDFLNTRPPSQTWVGPHQAALTFDDGPSQYTPGLISALGGVPVTFFTVGYEVAARPDLVQLEARSGDSVEDHTWDHKDLTRLSLADVDNELNGDANAVQSAIGVRPKCFRPPYGATNSTVVNEAARLGLTQIMWNVVPYDYQLPGVGAIVSRVLSEANGRGIVVGMHDGGGDRSQTIAAMPAIISGLRARGYTFVRLCA